MADDNLKNLPPEERIKKLKELEEKKKKEIEEAQKLLRESESELRDRRKFLDKVPIPQVARNDLKDLTLEEKAILKVQKGLSDKKDEKEEEKEDHFKKKGFTSDKKVSDLESLAGGSGGNSGRNTFLGFNQEYIAHLSQEPVRNLYQEMIGIKTQVEEKGYVSGADQRKIEYISQAIEQKFDEGYSFSEELAKTALLTQQIGSQLKDSYHQRKEKRNDLYR